MTSFPVEIAWREQLFFFLKIENSSSFRALVAANDLGGGEVNQTSRKEGGSSWT